MSLRRIAGVVFRLYVLALVGGILALLVWFVGGLPGLSEEVATLWYAIAGVGSLAFLLLLAVRILAN